MVSGADQGLEVSLLPPAIIKPEQLWTGKQVLRMMLRSSSSSSSLLSFFLFLPLLLLLLLLQVFSMMLRPNKDSKVLANLETKGKSYTSGRELCTKDGFVVIRNSELLAGTMDKSTMGSGTKANIFYVLLRDFGEVCSSFLQGFFLTCPP